ncbi:hypothetical protein E2562_006361 [Oryza meyeriana var. granulata]|uniref:Uncharacterized protein n=1 Tax=Oryza meyeriana var. granulata TaxID=110450 RepID=A0A6G1EGE4_9ORYZ|nr:hypothetical protein E2562_006361 [Oryza meyeriana var. granulata]
MALSLENQGIQLEVTRERDTAVERWWTRREGDEGGSKWRLIRRDGVARWAANQEEIHQRLI